MQKVVVGMSGGVDSSVAAYLLKEQGYDVIGVTMQIWQDEDVCSISENGGCCGLGAVEDSKRVASVLKIPHYVMNFRKEFKKNVIDYFVSEYVMARTPNPCIACNRYVKWESLLARSLSIGADYIATGHYASIAKLTNGRYAIKNSVTKTKDQTYALYNLTQYQLEHTLMPVGDYTKDEIREIAHKLKLPVANKADSQEICFVENNDYAGFIREYLEDEDNKKILEEKRAIYMRNMENGGYGFIPGNFVDSSGNILGKHQGLANYTIGQRKGLNIALGRPVFVLKLNPITNEVVIGDADDVFADRFYVGDLNFMAIEDLQDEMVVNTKIRYGHKGAPCTIKRTAADEILCVFDEPQRAVTPGQAAVFYKDDYVVGGGVIK